MTKPLYFYNGTTFEQVGPTTPQSPIAYQTSAPTGPATGDLWIDSDGDVDTYNRQLTRYYFVATAAQTTISGVDANSLTLAYVAGSEAVYVNGALQVRGQDYTATNGTSVVMSSGLAVNDVVEIFAYTAFTVANAYTKTETDGVAAAAAGLRMVVPTSVAVGSGTGSVDATGNVTFSGASSVSLNGCFTSAYDNYKIKITGFYGSVNSISVTTQLRKSGTNNSDSNSYRRMGFYANSSTLGNSTATTTSYYTTSLNSGATAPAWVEFDLYLPFINNQTGLNVITYRADDESVNTAFGRHTTVDTFDGVSFSASSGNMTGTIRVYGYKD